MKSNVLRLVSSNTPKPKSCETCAFFHPNTDAFGWERRWIFFRDKPTASAFRFAICSAFGGNYASVERGTKCHGEFHDDAPERSY